MKTKVAFRKFDDGDIIALFPEERFTVDHLKYVSSYMHVGQHGTASEDLINDLEDAEPEEYEALKQELEEIGYELDV